MPGTFAFAGALPQENELDLTVDDIQKAGWKYVEATVTVRAPASRFQAVETDNGWMIEAVLFLAAVDTGGGQSDVPAIPLVMVTENPPDDQTVVKYTAKLKLRKKTERLSAALHDVASGNTLTGTISKSD